MDKAWLSGASATPPTAPASPSIGYPTAGIPGSVPPTNPGAYMFHMIVMEILNTITAAGLTPAQGTLTQLRDAVISLSSGNRKYGTFAFVDVDPGPPHTDATVTFSTAFPTACDNLQITIQEPTGYGVSVVITSVSASGFTCHMAGGSNVENVTIHWLAFGH